jgi:hypothetical protein
MERAMPHLGSSGLAVHHNPQDLWELPELLFGLCEDYRFHVRQHQFNSFDSVLYAVPN